MQIEDLRERLRALGAGPGHETSVLRAWLNGRALDHGKRAAEDFLPKTVRVGLPAIETSLHELAQVRSEHVGADGSIRSIVAPWRAVLIPITRTPSR